MASPTAAAKMSSLAALRRQQLLAEFAGLKQACPHGVFVSLTPGDPSLWSGVIFVRKGPYATAVLRFQISFPDTFPSLPPLVTFSTDMFHPLITPLTTYMYTTDIQDGGTVSATDEERLPPGGFSLRHGFPDWFGRATRRNRQVSSQSTQTPLSTPPRPVVGSASAAGSTPGSVASSAASDALASHARRKDVSTFEVLRYIRSTFDDEDVLDSVPLEAAGNPGAWHAWKARQRQATSPGAGAGPGIGAGKALPPEPGAKGGGGGGGGGTARKPGEWNWEGVWEERVKRGIAASLSEGVLYGNAGAADEVINFLSMDEAEVDGAKKNLFRTLGTAA
ncbi:protein crossbronx [Podospora aff. communis PSN243]|uniref:Protein crossbronx n=1 Tax=Podospora aff. communis PSN243 TaxID=3040156 RepID=A0AAV9GNR9_9PEZI|nr:protein crossbronx [Podospora aff. communis PSN243]